MHPVPTYAGSSQRDRALEWLAWAAVLVAAAALLAGLDFRTRDPDSALHAAIVTDLAGQPLRQWVTPEWGGHWSRQGLFKEHPAGLFLLSWPLVAAGYPPAQAPIAVNMVFQVLCLVMLQRLARVLGTADEARAVGWLLQLLPIAFVFRIRANHEQLVLFFYLAALVAAERARERPAWFGAVGLATVGVMLVKGVFAALVPLSCALWLVWRPARTHRLRLATWAGLALSALLALGAAAGYEHVYRGITGEPFIRPYLTQQLVVAADRPRDAESLPGVQQVRNAGWYAGRVLWYAFPWSLVCLWLLLPRTWRPRRWNAAATRNEVLFLALAGLWVAALSLAARRADRYAFPVYYISAVVGAMAAMQHLPIMRRVPAALARIRPLEVVLVWAVTFALALAPLWHLFPKFKLVDNY